MKHAVRPQRGLNATPKEIMDAEIAWRDFKPPALTRAIQDFTLEVLENTLFGDPRDGEFDGVQWMLDPNKMTAHMLCGDSEIVILDIGELIELEIAQREGFDFDSFLPSYLDDSETYLMIANRFKAWAVRLEKAAIAQELALSKWGDERRAKLAKIGQGQST